VHTTVSVLDAEGKLTGLTDPAGRAWAFAYEPARGLLRSVSYPNGTFSCLAYNQAGWQTAIRHVQGSLPGTLPEDCAGLAGSELTGHLLEYTPTGTDSDVAAWEGKRTKETRTGAGLATETTTYRYDPLGRLNQVTLPSGTVRTYCFDQDSNRTQIRTSGTCGSGGATETYTYDPLNPLTDGVDQLTSRTAGVTTSYEYSADGEVTKRGTDTLAWDGYGRLSGGTYSGQTVTYTFDPVGFRRQRVSQGVTTQYRLAGQYETDSAATITLTAIPGPTGDLAHYQGPPLVGTTVVYRYYNTHGDLAATADQAGARTNAYTYDPYGSPNQAVAANQTEERWTGRHDKKLDTTTGLIEMGARPYDPTLGRFLTTDPIQGGSCNTYDYTCQDPINNHDLDGLSVVVPFPAFKEGYTSAGPFNGLQINTGTVGVPGGTLQINTDRRFFPDSAAQIHTGLDRTPRDTILRRDIFRVVVPLGSWRIKVALGNAHHRFRLVGKQPHLQVNIWKAGVKGSGLTPRRLPLPVKRPRK
jgi:RHS repeat-associated protein